MLGKYTLLELDHSANNTNRDNSDENQPEIQVQESNLLDIVQDLIRLICDVNMIKLSLQKQGCDVNKMPLGNISQIMVKV